MNPIRLPIVLLASIGVAACSLDHDGLARGVPPSPRPSGARADADRLPPTSPDAGDDPDAARIDAGVSDDGGPKAPPDASASSVTSVADAGLTPLPDSAPLPDVAPPPEPADDPPGTCPQTPELALCLRFEGAVRDDSRYRLAPAGNNLTFQAGPTGQAADMNPRSSIVVPPNPLFDSAAVTLEAWVSPRALGRRMGVIFNGNNYHLVILPSGSAMCTGGGGYALTPDAVRPGQWTSLACTYDADRVTLWIDGRQTAENPRTGPVRTGSPTGVAVGYEVPDGNAFDGFVDNVRVWRQVRSPRQLCASARACTPSAAAPR